jgi:hypothetical protein
MALDTKSLINEAMSAVATGNTSAVHADTREPIGESPEADTDDHIAVASEESQDDTVIDADARPEPQETKPSTSDDVETITVTDHKGKRQISIDYSDKAKIKKAFQLAAGMRKFQAERDAERTKAETSTKQLSEYQARFQKLEAAWESGREDGILRLLTGGKGVDDIVAERAAKAQRRAEATPAELARMDAEEAISSKDSELQRVSNRVKELEGKLEQNLTTAEQQKMEAMTHPVFDKYRFSGKSGDKETARDMDEMLWLKATRTLDSYAEQGINITPAIVDQEFKRLHSIMSRAIKTEADAQVSNVITSKKSNALGTAQTMVNKSLSGNSYGKKADEALANGDIKSFFRLSRKR